MLSNRLAFAALAVACIGAAAGGGYLATRQNTVPTPASAQAQPVPAVAPTPAAATPTAPVTTAAAPAKALRDTEPVVADTPRKPVATTKASATRQTDTAARPGAPRDDRATDSAAAHRETASLIASNNAQPQPPAPLPPDGRERTACAASRRARGPGTVPAGRTAGAHLHRARRLGRFGDWPPDRDPRVE